MIICNILRDVNINLLAIHFVRYVFLLLLKIDILFINVIA